MSDKPVDTLLYEYSNGSDYQAKAACDELERRSQLLEQAIAIIARGVELMPLEQLSQWEGVREWQERV